MEAEASPIIADLNLEKDDPPVIAPPAPTLTFHGQLQGTKIHLACNGKDASSQLSALNSSGTEYMLKDMLLLEA